MTVIPDVSRDLKGDLRVAFSVFASNPCHPGPLSGPGQLLRLSQVPLKQLSLLFAGKNGTHRLMLPQFRGLEKSAS
tara:strand:+ start:58 stop:285 length:228 start_codon:yes stop_codon:yes gene_type:complete